MYINNVNELIETLKDKLPQYMEEYFGPDAGNTRKPFPCPFHDDHSPSMSYNPKNGFKTVKCWAGCGTFDIFAIANKVEGLPMTGPEFITDTLVALSEKMKLQVQVGEVTEEDKQRAKLYRIMQDATGLLETSSEADEYLEARGWSKEFLTIGSIGSEKIRAELTEKGWSAEELNRSMILGTGSSNFVDSHLVTFVIKDYRGRPIGFSSRNLTDHGPKYINSMQNLIFNKSMSLLGLDTALIHGKAKNEGLYVVEGPGDLAALHRVGIKNAVAICGTAFTGEHLSLLKMLGIRNVFFCLDWDDAGRSATERILRTEVKFAPGVSCHVIEQPEEGYTDPSEYLVENEEEGAFEKLKRISAFEWTLQRIADSASTEEVCSSMVPLIASEPSAIRREMLTKQLADFSGFSYISITQDVDVIRDGKEARRRERLEAAAQNYARTVMSDPTSITAALSRHESDVQNINKEFKKTTVGPSYQVSRYDALEEKKASVDTDSNMAEFKFSYYTEVGKALSGGMIATDGNLMYCGGHANSGKTATVISWGVDVAMSDPDAIVIMHFTDDSYSQVAPRALTTISRILTHNEQTIKIGIAANPYKNITEKNDWAMYNQATQVFRDLLAEDKLILIDSEDGASLDPLEKQLQYVRQRYPEKKILVVQDKVLSLWLRNSQSKVPKLLETPKAIPPQWCESRNKRMDCKREETHSYYTMGNQQRSP